MCTFGFIRRNGKTLVFKNRDNDFKHENERLERTEIAGVKQLVLMDGNGKYEGMNEHGVICVEGTLKPKNACEFSSGWPHFPDFLTAKTAKECVEKIEATPKISSSFLVVDNNEAYLVEKVPYDMKRKKIEADQFVAANSSQLLDGEGAQEGGYGAWSKTRLENAQKAIPGVNTEEDIIEKILRNHEGKEEGLSICGHGEIHTQSAFIYDPEALSVNHCLGKPCESSFSVEKL